MLRLTEFKTSNGSDVRVVLVDTTHLQNNSGIVNNNYIELGI